jgi:hypothetical protein
LLGCDILYIIKDGSLRGNPFFPESFSCDVPTAIHAVFGFDKHGTTYAVIENSLLPSNFIETAKFDWGKKIENIVVPHMVREPSPESLSDGKKLRQKLGIPLSAKVFCRHGGTDTFNIGYVHNAISDIVARFTPAQVHFVLVNTDHILVKKEKVISGQIHYLKAIPQLSPQFEEYFGMCDAMLHARQDGETFGLAVGEFAIR